MRSALLAQNVPRSGQRVVSSGQTVRLVGESQRAFAHRLIDLAPAGAVVNVKPEARSSSQNNFLWVCLSDISRAKPEGRRATPELWKAIFMSACGYAVQFEQGLDGQPFPVGFRSSRLSKAQMNELITFVLEYGDRNGVRWSEPRQQD